MTYPEVFRFYKSKSTEFIKRHTNVLKTDCYNEFHPNSIPIATDGSITLLEYDIDAIHKAKKKNPLLNIHCGDIRDIPFDDGLFDCVIDLSTLDHIAPDDVPKALSEYRRVLTDTGEVLLVVWTAEQEEKYTTWAPTHQYNFLLTKLEPAIQEHFTIVETYSLLNEIPPLAVRSLRYFHLRARL